MRNLRAINPLFNFGWIICSLSLIACGGSQERWAPDETYTVYDGEEVIFLDSQIESCSYVGFSQVIVVQGCHSALNAGARFDNYYDIAGFDPSWGTRYELIVEYWKSPQEIADAPSVMVKMKEIISQQEDPAGTRYEYLSMNIPFSFDSSGRFLMNAWTCGLDEGCSWISASTDPIDLTFEKQADGSMLLVEAAIAANRDEAL